MLDDAKRLSRWVAFALASGHCKIYPKIPKGSQGELHFHILLPSALLIDIHSAFRIILASAQSSVPCHLPGFPHHECLECIPVLICHGEGSTKVERTRIWTCSLLSLLVYIVFADAGSDVISCVSLNGRAILYLADADLIAKINGDRYSYPKPIKEYTVLKYVFPMGAHLSVCWTSFSSFFGPNLVTSEGLDWRSQHAISAPAFNRESIAFLWEESVSIMKDMYGSIKWHDTPVGQDIRVDHVVDMTLQVRYYCQAAIVSYKMIHSRWHFSQLRTQGSVCEASGRVMAKLQSVILCRFIKHFISSRSPLSWRCQCQTYVILRHFAMGNVTQLSPFLQWAYSLPIPRYVFCSLL